MIIEKGNSSAMHHLLIRPQTNVLSSAALRSDSSDSEPSRNLQVENGDMSIGE